MCSAVCVREFLAVMLLTVSGAGLVAQEAQFEIYREDAEIGLEIQQVLVNFEDWLDQQFSEEHLPGLAVAVVSKQAVLDIHTLGVRSVEDRQPITPASLFRIASVSKTFAGTLASLLVAGNMETWEKPIGELLPRIQIGTKPASGSITLKNIVSHTTGLMPHAYSNMLDAGVAYEKIQEKFREIPTVCEPGHCYGYQNVVFSLIGDVVEAATLKSYEEYLYEKIFQPLGMQSASTGLDSFQASAYATSPHRQVGENWRTTSHNPAYYTVAPAAGINASITDMAIWARANLGAYPEVLSEEFLHAQHEPVIETPRGNYFNRWKGVEKAYYALGWRVFDYRGMRVVHHGGGVRGFRSEVALVPEQELGLVVLFNAETTVANDVVPAFLDNLIP